MQVEYSIYYRKRGIRQLQQIASPALQPLTELSLPMNSVLHYWDNEGNTMGPESSNLFFRDLQKPIQIQHVLQLSGKQMGLPKINGAFQSLNAQREYHNRHRRFRLMRDIKAVDRDRQSLIVMNYAMLASSTMYVRSFFTKYHRWHNTLSTVLTHINSMSEFSTRQHFLPVYIPKVLPSLNQLQQTPKEINQRFLQLYQSEEAFFLVEMWKWLGNEPQNSLLSTIPLNKLHLVNLVYMEAGEWTVVNLGQLWAWRRASKEEKLPESIEATAPAISSTLKVDPIQLQKRFMGLMIKIMEARTLAAKKDNAPETNSTIKSVQSSLVQKIRAEDEDETSEVVATKDSIDDLSVAPAPEDNVEALTHAAHDEQVMDEEEIDEEARIEAEDRRLDEELAALNDIASRQEQESHQQEESLSEMLSTADNTELNEGVIHLCDRLADEGMLSAGEYKKFLKLADAYKTIVSPNLVQTLDEYIKIDPKELEIKEDISIPDTKTVLDKSMLKSSLLDFDKRYVSKYLERDVASMVLNLQNAGIAVTDYQTERVGDIMGEYLDITMSLAPVIGKSSTLKAKIPIVQPDGTYRSNGVRYRLRKQRGDLPIRKVNPSRVALTSYYGKLFVNRSKRKTNDYGHWLQSQVMAKGLSQNDPHISKLVTGDVFNNEFVCPRAYSALSDGIQSFVVGSWTLHFNREAILKLVSPEILKQYETNGAVVMGLDGAGNYLVLDRNNTVYNADGQGQLTPLEPIESFLGLQRSDAPVESAGLVIFGKEIPLGVILSYYLGFDKLLRLLKVEPRRVQAGARLQMTTEEYAIVFSDETLIFPKDNALAAMILSGFNEYHRSLKLFSVYSFNKRGVYLNLLESNGLSTRYMRELDLLTKLYVDPITKELLLEMGEPTKFEGLLLSAAQKLLDDQHPDELDPAYQRYKGYERFAGALYAELVQSVRAHSGKLGKSSSPIELNPYQVWRRISEDPAKTQISEINPIEALKGVEAVTLGGDGGRSRRSMTKGTRSYHPNDIGVVSESTVDSSDVAINIFTSANPQFKNLRGITKRFDMKERPTSSLLSTSGLNAVAHDRDD